MAKALGLQLEQIIATDEALTVSLHEPGSVYPFPFADHSIVPSSELARAVVLRVGKGTTILNGTGADGVYGMSEKVGSWLHAARVPGVLRRVAGSSYRFLWRSSGRSECVSRLLRRSGQMPIVSAILAQNALAGILYDHGPADEVHRLLDDWVSGMVGSESILRQAMVGDVALT